MEAEVPWFGVGSYGVAALVYGALALLLIVSRPVSRPSWTPLVMLASSVWAAALAFLLARGDLPLTAVVGLDAAHLFIWTLFILAWLTPSFVRRGLRLASVVAGLWAFAASLPIFAVALDSWAFTGLTVGSLLALLAVEQVSRNAREVERRSMRLLCGAAGGVAVIDLVVYSQAVLLDGVVPLFWYARGAANALLVPLIVLGIRHQAEGERELFVSRQVVFYTASLLGIGGYLLVMGGAAYVIRALGAQWNVGLELIFLAVAVAVLLFVLFTTSIRLRFRAFLVKNFYSNKYDYRDEWLRLTQSLGRSGELQVLAERGLDALAHVVGAQQGGLWLARSSEHYEWMASHGEHVAAPKEYAADHPMVTFLASRSWVIDSDEYAASPDHYANAFGSPEEGVLPSNSIIVPLDCQGFLQGFVTLTKPARAAPLNFEDHDILKTAGKQVAIVLAQSLAVEKLAETRQFEAMNKMSTFLMHDLKNIIAQQQLVVSNAARFRDRPEFFDDAIATVKAGVERMRHLLEQLRAPPGLGGGRAEVTRVLMEVRSHCADRRPIPTIAAGDAPVWVEIERTKLASLLTHLVRNAQDATPADGSIEIRVAVAAKEVLFTVSDTGSGMDQGFIRDRLFRPFDSTKGARGMGIGAYQVRDMVRSAGGDVEVTSEPNEGTKFRVRLPIAHDGHAVDERGDAAR